MDTDKAWLLGVPFLFMVVCTGIDPDTSFFVHVGTTHRDGDWKDRYVHQNQVADESAWVYIGEISDGEACSPC